MPGTCPEPEKRFGQKSSLGVTKRQRVKEWRWQTAWEYREKSVRHREREPMSLKIICGGHLLSYVTWTPLIATEPFESMKLTRVFFFAGEGALFIPRRGL